MGEHGLPPPGFSGIRGFYLAGFLWSLHKGDQCSLRTAPINQALVGHAEGGARATRKSGPNARHELGI